MTAVARKPAEKLIPAIDIFRERCEARAILVEACLYDPQEAVDGLQADAERTGLVDELGQDAVQRMMADAFAIVPKEVVIQPPLATGLGATSKPHRPDGAATSTLQAADYLIQQKDPARLKAWLAKHTRAERIATSKHLHRAKP
jgi:hypothetical protein